MLEERLNEHMRGLECDDAQAPSQAKGFRDPSVTQDRGRVAVVQRIVGEELGPGHLRGCRPVAGVCPARSGAQIEIEPHDRPVRNGVQTGLNITVAQPDVDGFADGGVGEPRRFKRQLGPYDLPRGTAIA